LFGAHWLEAVPVVQAFCAIGVLASIGVLQSSLINSNGNAELWLLYILAKQIGAAFYIWLFYRYGVAELSASLAILTYLMWLPSVYIVARILGMRMRDYLATFAVPLTATLALVAALSLLQLYWRPSEPLPRLAGAIAFGATVYCSVAWLLAHRQLLAIWRTISNRRRAA
jgi:O-antigen/teichoic acid export membrane protein